MRHFRVFLSVILCIVGCVLFVGSAAAQPAASVTPPAHWKHDIAAFVAHDKTNPPLQHGVLFIGSSSIRRWPTLQEDFPGVPVINRGFGGSTIADSTYYAD